SPLMKSWCVLVVLCLTCFCHGAYSCPATCKCYTRRAEVVCNEVSLTDNLTWLDLSGNQLMKIPTALLQKLPNLDNLDLANNQLEKIPANSLDSLSKLERLNMQNNKLNTLDASVFQTTRNLTSLFLTRNKLSKLPQNLFQELTQLRHLSLDDNQLSHIPAGLLDPLTSLDEEGLDLTGNPFLCDGKVEYLWRWLQKNKTKAFLPETITCGGPESLVGRPVMSLTASELKIQNARDDSPGASFTPTDLSRLLLVASQIAELFQSCPFVFNDVEHVGVRGRCNGSVLQLTSSGCV
uniref:LRRCT domain-containing protein n=1 Tax=Stegastes partitus TaxID=144197 RepID=A0A3B5BBE6_9TELE